MNHENGRERDRTGATGASAGRRRNDPLPSLRNRMSASGKQLVSNERLPAVPAAALPWLTVEQMREVDRVMIEELQITLARMMENAGSCLAEVARIMLGGSADG